MIPDILLNNLYPQFLKPKSPLPNWKIILAAIIAVIILIGILWGRAKAEVTPLSIAQSQIGLGEIGGNNQGCYVRQYLNGQEGLPWCAGFVSYCIKKAGYSLPYFLRAKSYLEVGIKVNNPQVGDLMIFSRQGGGHVEIIEEVTKNIITTIAGNTGNFPSVVKRITYKRNNIKNLLGFVRLSKIH